MAATLAPKAAQRPEPRAPNTISGRVTLKESGLGVPDLLVVVYDATTRGPTRVRAGRGTTNAAADPRGRRVASITTEEDGSFSVTCEDTEFGGGPSANGSRPELVLTVLAPDDADGGPAGPTVLYRAAARPGAGRRESYLIRLTARQLEEAGIPVPRTEDDDVGTKVANYRSLQRSKLSLNKGMADFHREVLAVNVEEKAAFRSRILASVAPDLASVLQSGVLVRDGESIKSGTTEVTEKGIDRANRMLGGGGAGVPVNIYLTPDDKAELQEYFDEAVGGVAEIPESKIRPILFQTAGSENIGTLLVKDNPIVKYCREKTLDETCAIDHLAGPDHDGGGTGGGPEREPDPGRISSEDIPRFIDRLVSDMPSPDTVVRPRAVASRPTQADVQKSVDDFSLRKGPADFPAYFALRYLQVAFEHVWKQLFDEDVVNGGYRLHQTLKSKTGMSALDLDAVTFGALHNLVFTAGSSEIADVPVEVAAHFEITREEWNELPPTFRSQLSALALRIDGLLYKTMPAVYTRGNVEVRDHRDGATTLVPKELSLAEEKLRQFLVEQGERIIDSVRHDDYYTMHKTLRDLHERMNGAYEYTVFAADKDHCAVNFGIVTEYQGELRPVVYQVGRLCKTIPLAPKEERRYSTKITRHTKRSEKDTRRSTTSSTTEATQTSRLEAEIAAKAMNKTSFSLATEGSFDIGISSGDVKTSFGVDAQKESQQTRKDIRDTVLKVAQAINNEYSVDVTTEVAEDAEFTDSAVIVNPNDELAVTYLFYELQRRYRVSEQLYRVLPVVLVAQPVPRPDEITEAWVIAHDWIIDRFLLDESFRPALQYLATKSVGDDFALRELRRNLRQQRSLLETLKIELSMARSEADNRYRALEAAIRARIREEEREATDGWFSDVGDFFGGGGQDPEAAKARELAASDAHQQAVDKAEKMAQALRQEVDGLHRLTAEYNRTLRDHLDNETRTKRLLLHIRNNVLYYMQAIWSMEPVHQRALRLQKVQVPDVELDDADGSGRTYRVQVAASPDIFAPFRPAGTEKHKATVTGRLKKPFTYKPLVEVACLEGPPVFWANYMVLPLKQHNALTEFMAAPYVDSAFGAMDPDELSNVNLDDFAKFVCCLHDHEPARFEELKPVLHQWFNQLLADPLRNGDEVVIPSGSLYIELLPSANGLLEDFKRLHRELDVYKVAAEVRKAELENLRLADRLLNAEREDPEIDRRILVQGDTGTIVVPPDN